MMSGLSAQDLHRIRDAANLLVEEGLDDDLAADLDLIGDRLADQLKLEIDTGVITLHVTPDEFLKLRTIAGFLQATSLEIAVGKRGFVGAGELGHQAGELQKTLNQIAERLDN